jgi:hypothetical protein
MAIIRFSAALTLGGFARLFISNVNYAAGTLWWSALWPVEFYISIYFPVYRTGISWPSHVSKGFQTVLERADKEGLGPRLASMVVHLRRHVGSGCDFASSRRYQAARLLDRRLL